MGQKLQSQKSPNNDDAQEILFEGWSVKEDDGIYYESQERKTDTCFQHALNHYFQRKYVTAPQFMEMYCTALLGNAEKIQAIKKMQGNSRVSFYGQNAVPKATDLVEGSSAMEQNEDLMGYWELYEQSSVEIVVETLRQNEFKKLSPFDALFLLEFQMDTDAEHFPSNRLLYVPHRLYHRYSRSKDVEDQTQSKQMFVEALRRDKKVDRVYLSQIESGKSHAFCAMKDVKSEKWILLDSLLKRYGFMQNEQQMIDEKVFCGRASVLILRDYGRKSIALDDFEEDDK